MKATPETLQFLRRGGTTQRWHTEGAGLGESVAAHSFGVATLIVTYCNNPSPRLVKTALYHDLAEHQVGDVPAPAKWASATLALTLAELERAAMTRVGLDYNPVALDHYEATWLTACDRLDALLYCVGMAEQGNLRAYRIVAALWDSLGAWTDWTRYADLVGLMDAVALYAMCLHKGKLTLLPTDTFYVARRQFKQETE